jgi:hypothetical protein
VAASDGVSAASARPWCRRRRAGLKIRPALHAKRVRHLVACQRQLACSPRRCCLTSTICFISMRHIAAVVTDLLAWRNAGLTRIDALLQVGTVRVSGGPRCHMPAGSRIDPY